MKKNIIKVIVEQAEGLTVDLKPFTFEGPNCVDEAERKLRQIAVTAPEGGGYYKTDVTLTLKDGTDYQFRFDIMRLGSDDNDVEILPHALNMFECYGGLKVPQRYADKYTVEQWLKLMTSRHGIESVMELRRLYDVLVSTGEVRKPVVTETAQDLALNRMMN